MARRCWKDYLLAYAIKLLFTSGKVYFAELGLDDVICADELLLELSLLSTLPLNNTQEKDTLF